MSDKDRRNMFSVGNLQAAIKLLFAVDSEDGRLDAVIELQPYGGDGLIHAAGDLAETSFCRLFDSDSINKTFQILREFKVCSPGVFST